ncbi:unnamed protein product [Tuber melanosporum]|uniref:(Perigord truffle) hypothetical protein n=1 Tax=Tuber melanosporum (strain Mel28) TaxID=656061 RepID=D5GMH1_TUBMM|nr:uncharacterized protein GSTUM_00010713001 [Tuber melanosporum]CAZ85714.1 unnamed protein product [Tuber melanosporum]
MHRLYYKDGSTRYSISTSTYIVLYNTTVLIYGKTCNNIRGMSATLWLQYKNQE